MAYREGDFWRTDDRTGRKVLASRTVKEWTGLIVDRNHAIDLNRHPQEIQKIVLEKPVQDPRPRPIDVFIGPLKTVTTVAVLAGSVILPVASIVRWEIGDTIGILLGNRDLWLTTVRQVYAHIAAGGQAYSEFAYSEGPDDAVSSALEIVTPLPWDVDLGALVVNYTSTANPDLVDSSQAARDFALIIPPPPAREPALLSFDDSFDESFG